MTPVACTVYSNGLLDCIEAGAHGPVTHRVHVDEKAIGVRAAHQGIQGLRFDQQVAAHASSSFIRVEHGRRVLVDFPIQKNLDRVGPDAPAAHALSSFQ